MKRGYKECPFCKNEIKKEAIKCQYCKEMLPKEEPIEEESDTKICPFCKNEIKKEAKKCQYCKEFLDESSNKVRKTITTERNENTNNIKSKKDIENDIMEAAGIKNSSLIPNRLSRGRYFVLTVITNIIFIILMMIFGGLGIDFMLPIIIVINIIIHIYLTAKRFHDVGVNGRAGLTCIIPVVIIILYFIPGEKLRNEYGPAPLD